MGVKRGEGREREHAYMYFRPEFCDIVAILTKPSIEIADGPRKANGILGL